MRTLNRSIATKEQIKIHRKALEGEIAAEIALENLESAIKRAEDWKVD